MEKSSKKGKLVAGVAAMSLAACCMAAPAFAADNATATTGTSNTTTVTLTAADTQMKFTVPTVIAFAANADGSLQGPSADSVKITNQSVYPIHVTKVSAAEQAPFNLVSDVSGGTDANAVSFTMKTGATTVDAAAGKDTSAVADFDLGYAGSGTDSISFETAGKLARANADLSKAQQIATVSWTLAPGVAAQA